MLSYKFESNALCHVNTLRSAILADAPGRVEVSRLVNLKGCACDLAQYSNPQLEFGLALMAQSLKPIEIMGFSVWLGRGCESLFLGLAQTEKGFLWEGVCETYGDKTPNKEVFEHRHVTAVAILDMAVKFGIGVKVTDYSGYYESRDLRALRRAAEDSDGVIAMLDQHRGNPLVDLMRTMHGGQYDEKPV